MQEQIVINNQLISFSSFGNQKNKLTIIFLHGWRSQKEVWNEVINQVIKLSSHQVYALDLPGFGRSPVPKASWTVEDYAKTVKAFIEKLELKNVVLVGHSFGGRVGIKLASQHPKILFKLVLVDSAGFVDESFRKKFFSFLSKIAKPIFALAVFNGIKKKIYQTIGAEDYIATPELKNIFLNVVNEDLTEDMKKIHIPTLIIWGEKDKDTPIEFGQKMNSLIPNSELIILPNAGHYSFLDNREEFIKELDNFLYVQY